MRQAGPARTQPSQKWSRLKEIKLDPLEAIGLPSKGDNRLLEFKAQEEYYSKVLDRYKQLQKADSQDDILDRNLAGLSLDDGTAAKEVEETVQSTIGPISTPMKESNSRDLAIILAAMRKLREAMVASARTDTFALTVYVFIIRATILSGHMESYHPAILHLLRKILPITPLSTKTESQAFVGYYILDLACRQDDLGRAFQVRHVYEYEDPHVEGMLKAMVRGDWNLYWRSQKQMDPYQRRLALWADQKMRTHALSCLGASYLSVGKDYVEDVAQQKWTADELAKMKPMWHLEDGIVVIKRTKRK